MEPEHHAGNFNRDGPIPGGVAKHLRLNVQLQSVAFLDGVGIGNDAQEPQVDGVAKEDSGKGLGDDGLQAGVLERYRSRLARAAAAEVVARHHEVPGAHSLSKLRTVFDKAGLGQLLGVGGDVVASGSDQVRVDVVPKLPVHRIGNLVQATYLLGSVMMPVRAEAAAVAGLARNILAVGLPMRPSKLRLLVETHTSLS